MSEGGRTAYVNARIFDPDHGALQRGALLTDGDLIADCGPGLFADGVPEGIATVDCAGHILAPGLVDMRVTLHEPGEAHKETIRGTAIAAATGGVTTIAALPGSDDPAMDNPALVEFVIARGRETGRLTIAPYGAITLGRRGEKLSEMGLLAEAGAVAFSDGARAVADAEVMRRALSYATTFDLLIVQHAEEPSLAAGGQMHEGELATRLGLQGIPAAAEVIMIERDLRLVELTGARYHVAHISTAEGIEAVRRAKARGLPVTCDTAPPYFGLNETAVGEYRTFAKLSPPLRSESDRAAVVAAIGDGTVDAIASDHLPQDPDSKRLPFAQAAPGGTGLETLLALSLALHHSEGVPLERVLRALTAAPAALLGLECGTLSRGAPADLVLIDPDHPWRISEDHLVAKSRNTPFDGRPVQGRALSTVKAGRTVFEAEA